MSRTWKGEYSPVNPQKYVGSYPIIYRSSWELAVCKMCDNHQNINEWASESVKIPYINPLTGKATVYVPDFLVSFVDAKGSSRVELWEVKPNKETFMEQAKTQKDKLALAVNAAKWRAAMKWASKQGITFKVITENDIFRNPK